MRQTITNKPDDHNPTQTVVPMDFGREPRRSRADRLTLSARRGRFSPVKTLDPPERRTGGCRQGGRSAARRRLTHGLQFVIVAGFAGLIGFIDFGHPAIASGKTKENAERKQNAKRAQSADASVDLTSATLFPPKPDYRSKAKTSPPPKSDRPLKVTEKRLRAKEKPAREKRPVDRPPKEKKGRPDTKEKPRREKPSKPKEPRPRVTPLPHVPRPYSPPPPPVEIHYVYTDYYDAGPSETNWESHSILLTTASLVLNGVYIQAGERNAFAAILGFVSGAASLAVGTRDDAKVPVLDYFLGAASIALGIWNLAGGIQRLDPSAEDVEVYRPTNTAPGSASQTVLYSFSF